MYFANCAALAAVLFITLTQILRHCSFPEAGLFLICSKILSKKEPLVLIKKVYFSKVEIAEFLRSFRCLNSKYTQFDLNNW